MVPLPSEKIVKSAEFLKMKNDQFNFLKNKFDLEKIFDFCWNNVVEVLLQSDGQYHCFINYSDGDGCYSADLDALTAMVIGIEKYIIHKEKQDEKNK